MFEDIGESTPDRVSCAVTCGLDLLLGELDWILNSGPLCVTTVFL